MGVDARLRTLERAAAAGDYSAFLLWLEERALAGVTDGLPRVLVVYEPRGEGLPGRYTFSAVPDEYLWEEALDEGESPTSTLVDAAASVFAYQGLAHTWARPYEGSVLSYSDYDGDRFSYGYGFTRAEAAAIDAALR